MEELVPGAGSLQWSEDILLLQQLSVFLDRSLEALPEPVGILFLPVHLGGPVYPSGLLRLVVASQLGISMEVQFLALPAAFLGAAAVVWKPVFSRQALWLC